MTFGIEAAEVGTGASASPALAARAGGGLERARGRAEIGFSASDGVTRIRRMFQEGQAKIRVPNSHGGAPTAVLLNTAGGIAGGDRLSYAAVWDAGTAATVTSQAAERVYRATGAGETGAIDNRIEVGTGARAAWLPQETILFDGARLDRRLEVDIAADASLLMVETVLFGRSAMGETVGLLHLADRWRVRRGGRLVYADTLRIDGDAAAILAGPATGRGPAHDGVSAASAVATSTVLMIAPEAESRLDEAREIVDSFDTETGVSAWDGLVAIRMVSASAQALRRDLVTLLERLGGVPVPRPWSC